MRRGLQTLRHRSCYRATNVHGSTRLAQGIRAEQSVEACVDAAGYDEIASRIDPSVVRGLEYYTGPVFEAELTTPIKDERGHTDPPRLGGERRTL